MHTYLEDGCVEDERLTCPTYLVWRGVKQEQETLVSKVKLNLILSAPAACNKVEREERF